MPKQFLSINEAAAQLGISPKTLRRWEEQGIITPKRTIGNQRRYALSDLTSVGNKTLTIHQAATQLGVSAKTLRRWEEKGLLVPERTSGNQRRYSQHAINKLGMQQYPNAPKRKTKNGPLPTPNFVPLPVTRHAEFISASHTPVIARNERTSDEAISTANSNKNEIATSPAERDPRNDNVKNETDTPRQFRFSNLPHLPRPNKYLAYGFISLCLVIISTGLFLYSGDSRAILSQLFTNEQKKHANNQVLQASTKAHDFALRVSVNADFLKNASVSGILTAPNITYRVIAGDNITVTGDPQNPVISAVVEDLEAFGLIAGDGIAIDGTTITNTAPGTDQNIFGNIKVGSTTISAGSNTDTFELAAGSNISLTTDTGNKKITIAADVPTPDSGIDGIEVLEGGTSVSDTITALDFLGGDFDVGESPTGEANIQLASTLTSVTGVTGSFAVANDLAVTGNVDIDGTFTLGSDTVNDLTGVGLTVSGSTLQVNLTTLGGAGSLSSNSGLEVGANGLTLLKGCSDTQVLKWDDTNTVWQCANDTGGGGVVGGTGAANQIAFWTDPSTISGNNDFYWNNTTERLGIGTNGAPLTTFDLRGNTSHLAAASLSANTSAATLIVDNTTGALFTASSSGLTRFTIAQNGDVTSSGNLAIDGSLSNLSGSTLTINDALAVLGGISLTGAISDSDSALLLDDETNIGSLANGINIATNGVISDNDGNVNINDNTDIAGDLDLSGSLTSGNSNAFQVDANGNISSTGTTGITLSGDDAGFTFSGNNNHLISASSGTLQLGAATLTGAITGGGQNITNLGQLTVDNLELNGNTLSSTASDLILNSFSGSIQLADLTTNGVVYTSGGNGTLNTESLLNVARGGTGVNGSGASNGQLLIGNGSGFSLANLSAGSGITITDGAGTIQISQTGSGASKWTQLDASGILYPNIATLDLLVGGVSSETAKFAFLNNAGGTPVASIAGNLTLDSQGVIQTTENQTLTLGGDATGNIILSPRNGSGDVRINGTTTLNGLTYTWPGSQGTNYVLQTDGNGILTWMDPGTLPTANYWVQGNGILYPKIADVFDFLLGGESTTSAEFAITGINNGTPIATLSAIANNTGLSLNASTGTLQSLNYGTLTLGGDTTGNISIAPKAGTGTLALNAGELTINGTPGETSVSPTCVSVTNGIVTGLGGCGAGSGGSVWTLNTTDGTLYPINNTMDLLFGGASTASAKFAFLNIAGNTPTASLSAITTANALSLDATGIIGTTNKQTLTLGTASTGDINLVIGGSNELRINGTAGADVGTATCVIASNGIVTGTGSCDTPLSSFIWSTSADGGAIIQGNTTRDLLIGGEATTSAKFAVLNVNSGTPTATLSGQTGGTYLTANGELRTENNQSLTLGGTGTGNIVLDSGNNVIRLADLATNGVVYTSGGNGTLNTETLLDVSRGGTGINGASATDGQLLIGNDSGNGFTLANLTEGAGITITNGAGAITIAQNAVGLSKWTQNATDGTLYPTISTLDLLVGGVATNSAKFAFINSAGGVPTASISAIATNNALILDAAGNIATTNKQTLTLGTTSTGNILIGSDATARDITIGSSSTTGLSLTDNNWSVTAAGLATFTQANVDNLQLDGNTLQTNSGNLILDSAGSTLLSDLSTDGVVFTSNGDGTLSTEATLSVSRGGIGMDATTVTNGQILIGNDTNNDFDLATLTPGAGIQITNAAGSITIAQTETGGSKWTQSDANGVLHPNIETLDLLVGGVATNSAKFAVLNVAGGTPVASVSSGTGGGGTYLTANGTLSTTNKQTLTLGDFTNTGNINVISESNNGRIDNYFGLFSPIGFSVNQTVVGERLSISGYGQVGINLLNSTTNPHLAALDLRAPVGLYGGTQPVASISGRTSFAGLVVDNSVGDIFTASSSGLPRFTIHQNGTISAPNYAGNNAILYAAPTTGQLTALTTNSSTLCLVSGTSTPSWTSCTGAGSNWDVTNGVLTPKLASTLDLLIGGTTSSSARFHAFSSLNAGTTPAASVSANSNSFAGLVVDNRGNGDIFTASRGGKTVFTIGNDRVQIGTGSATGAGGAETPQLLGLDSKGSTGDPTNGRQGDMYYNTVDEKFRCYQGTGWRDCIAISQSEYLRAERISTQLAPELDVNDRIYFNVASSSAGSSISLNTSSYGNGGGQITLKAGRTYRLYSDINQRTIFTNNTTALVYGWYNVTSSAYIGSSGSVVPVDVAFGDSRNQGSPAEAVFTPSVDTTVEVRIRDLNGGSLTSIGFSTLNLYPYSYIEVISGAQELSASEYLRAYSSADQTADKAAGDHLKIDTVQAFSGSSITLNTDTYPSQGRFTLFAGKTYKLNAYIPFVAFSGNDGYLTFRWYNVTSSSYLGTGGWVSPVTRSSAYASGPYAEAIITPTVSTVVEVRIDDASLVDFIGDTSPNLQNPSVFIEVLSDGTKVAQFTGATSAADGAIGYVPAPLAGQEGSLLLGNGTWTAATNVKIGTTLTQPIASLSARTSFAGLIVDNQLGDLFAASSSGMSRFVIGQNGSITTNGVAGITSSNPVCVTTTNGIVTGTGACTGGTGGSNWTLDTTFGVIRPNNSTLDLLIGGASSASAKFHVYGTTNNNGIQPVASVSGNTSQAAFIVDNRVGDLFTASSSGLNRFVIKNNGQIGIGTAVPSANRDLEIASSNTFAYTKFNPTTNEDWTIGAEALGFIFFNDTDGQYRMVLDEEGNVGIGDTDPTVGSFARGLEISADGAGAALALTANAGRKFIIGSADTPAGLYFRDETAGAYRMVIDANGKIGINTGTTNVLGTLDLRGNTAHQPIASLSGSTSFAGLTIDNTTGDLFSASSSGTNRFVIKQNGNVGIGTTSPNAALHIKSNGSLANAGIEVNVNSWQPLISTNSALAQQVLNNQFTSNSVSLMGNYASRGLLVGQLNAGTFGFGGFTTRSYYTYVGNFTDNWAHGDLGTSAEPSGGEYIKFNTGNNAISFHTLGTEAVHMEWDQNASGPGGILGIGGEGTGFTTGSLFANLDVRGRSSVITHYPVASISGRTVKAALVVDNSGPGDLFTASSSGISRFVINQNGNVGIGTTLPTANLEVVSTIENIATFRRSGGDSTITLGGTQAIGNEQYITYQNADTGANAWMAGMDDDEEFKIDYTTAGEIRNSSALFTFEQSGEFGIGTNNPSQEIHLLGTTDATTAVRIEATNTGASTYAEVNLATSTRQYNYGVGGPGVTSALKNSFFIYDNSAPNTRFLISPIGTVGIGGGTSAVPIATLDLRGVVATFPVASISGSTNAGFAGLVVTNSGAGDIFTASSSGLERFTIKQNGQIQLDRTEYANCASLQAVNGLLTCGSGGNSAVYGINNAAGSGNTTSSSYADMPATSSLSFTKASGTSKLLITVSTGAFSTVTGTEVQIGVRIDSTDYDCGYFFFNTASQHDAFTCSVVISGSSAGSKTVQMRWKRTSGTGTVTQNNDDWNSLTVTEVEVGDSLALWDAANGTIFQRNVTQDLLIGGVSSASANFRVAGEPGDALIPTVDIIKTSNALTAGASNLALRLDKNSDTTGEAIGIGFTASTDNTNVGAKILHIRTGTASQGDLAFYTKGDNASSSDTTRQTLRLSSTGTSPIATFSGTTSFAGMVVDNSGRGDLFTASSSGLNRFVIKNNGNVGIGTTLPTQKLDIAGGSIDLDSGSGIYFNDSDANWFLSRRTGQGSLVTGNAMQFNLGGTSNEGFLLYRNAPNAQSLFEVSSVTGNIFINGGSLGMGTTSPLATLDVRGNSGTTPVASVSGRTSFASFVVDNSGAGDLFTASSSGLNRFVITQAGNVGIGTTNPTKPLHLVASTSSMTSGYGQYTDVTFAYPTSGSFYNAANATYVNLIGSANNTSSIYGNNTFVDGNGIGTYSNVYGGAFFLYDDHSSGTWTNATALLGDIYLQGGHTVTNATGVAASIVTDSSSGTTNITTARGVSSTIYTQDSSDTFTTAQGFYTRIGRAGSGTITSGYGLYIDSPLSLSGSTNIYGAYIGDQSAQNATTTYALYTAGGQVGFTGQSRGNALVTIDQTGSADIFTASKSGTTKFVINNNGSIGINTGTNNSTLLSTLDVRPNSGNGGTLSVASISGQTSFAAMVVDNQLGDIFTASSSGLNRFIIKQNGNVGIGTALPTEKLALAGGNFLQTIATGSARQVGVIKDGVGATDLNGAERVYVAGKYAYATALTDDAVTIIDVSNPASPTQVGVIKDGVGATDLNGAYDIYVAGKYAYVTAQLDDALTIIDVSNPASPTQVGVIKDGVGATDLDQTGSVYVAGKYAYVASNNDDALTIIDVSNPASPTQVGVIKDGVGATDLDLADGVYVAGKYAYVTAQTDDALTIIDVSNPASPTQVGVIKDGVGATDLNGAGYVYVSGKYAYATALTDDAVTIIDVSNPASPTQVGVIKDGVGATDLNGAAKIQVSGKYAYITAIDDDTLTIIDVSNPASPTQVAALKKNASATDLDGPVGVHVSGKFVYVTSVIDDALTIIDIPGLDAPAANIGNIATNDINVTENALIGNNLSIANGLNVGWGGILSNGAVAVSSGTASAALAVNSIAGGGDLFTASSSGLNRFVIKQNGSVGIGTANPNALLDVSHNSGDLRLRVATNITTDDYNLGVTTANGRKIVLTSEQGTLHQALVFGDSNGSTETIFGIAGSSDSGSNWSPHFVVEQGGNVGIGTDAPASKLDVTANTYNDGLRVTYVGVGGAGAAVYLDSTFGTSGRQWAMIATADSASNNNRGDLAFYDDTGGNYNFSLSSDGTARLRSTLSQSVAPDIAEGITVDDLSINAGDIISSDPNASDSARKTTSEYQSDVLGVVSTKPGILLNSGEDVMSSRDIAPDRRALVLAGRVPTKVTSKNGNIMIGDHITSSEIAGFGKKVTKAGVKVATALENFTPSPALCPAVASVEDIVWPADDGLNPAKPCYLLPDGTYVGKIMAFINVGWHDPDIYLTDTGNISVFEKDGAPELEAASTYGVTLPDGSEVIRTGVFSDAVIGNLRTGSLDVQSLSLGGTNLNDRLLGLESGFASTSANFTSTLQTQITSLSDRVASLEARLDLLTASGSGSFNFNSFTASSGAELSLDSLEVNGNILADSLNVLGYTTMNELSVTGSIRTGILTIKGQTNGGASISTLNGDLKLQDQGFGGLDILDGLVTIDTDGNIETQGEITAKKINIDTTDTLSSSAGTGTVPAGTKTTIIYTTAVTQDSLIQITFTSDYAPATRYWIKSKVAGDSFTVELNQPVTANAKFSWFIIN